MVSSRAGALAATLIVGADRLDVAQPIDQPTFHRFVHYAARDI
jgi:hypothetical protein